MASTDIKIALIEEDLFIRDLLTIMLTRDWRIQVTVDSKNLHDFLKLPIIDTNNIEVIVFSFDSRKDVDWKTIEDIRLKTPKIKFLALSNAINKFDLEKILTNPSFSGYLVKNEILYSLATAISRVNLRFWVMTPSVQKEIENSRLDKPNLGNVLGYNLQLIEKLTSAELRIMRLAILYSLSQKDIADEFNIRPDTVAKTVSRIYDKFDVRTIIEDEVLAHKLFSDQIVLNHLKAIRDGHKTSKDKGNIPKSSNMKTVAFHIATYPKEYPY